MNQDFKKWLFSGLAFILAGIIILSIAVLIVPKYSTIPHYIMISGASIISGYVIMRLINSIDSTKIPTLIFAVFSTILSGITLVIVQFTSEMNRLELVGYNIKYLSAVYVTIIVFLGLNMAYWYYYTKYSDKDFKDFIPHICGIVLIAYIYKVITTGFL